MYLTKPILSARRICRPSSPEAVGQSVILRYLFAFTFAAAASTTADLKVRTTTDAADLKVRTATDAADLKVRTTIDAADLKVRTTTDAADLKVRTTIDAADLKVRTTTDAADLKVRTATDAADLKVRTTTDAADLKVRTATDVVQAFRPAGVELASLDRNADPCADFYQFACGGWVAKNPLPADRRTFGRFTELQERNFVVLRRILETSGDDPSPGG